jgi:YVTN family beta-propeller protein
MELHLPESSFDRHNNVTRCNEGMKEEKAFGCASATSGSFARGKRSGRRLYDLRQVFAVIVGACILDSLSCAAQIEVNAYISNSGSNSVPVVDTKTNTLVGSPILVGIQPAGVAVTPDGRYAYVTNNGGDAISAIDTATNTVLASPIPLGSPAGIAVTPATNAVVGSPIVADTGLLLELRIAPARVLDWELQAGGAEGAKHYGPLALETASLSIDAIKARYPHLRPGLVM